MALAEPLVNGAPRGAVGAARLGVYLTTWAILTPPAVLHAQEDSSAPGAEESPDGSYFLAASVFLPLFGAGAAASMGTFPTPRLGVGIEGYTAVTALPQRDYEAIGATARYRLDGKVWVQAGVQVRNSRLDVGEVVQELSAGELRDVRQRTELGLDVAVGHRWYGSLLFLGIDWFGLYLPFVLLDGERRTVDPENDEILDRHDDDWQALPDVRLLHLHVGVVL